MKIKTNGGKNMANLLSETRQVLAQYDLELNDIRFIKTSEGDFYPSNGGRTFLNVEYDDGFGGQEIDPNLMIVGDDWWLERHEYDGSEWWEFKRLPRFEHRARCHVTPFAR